MREHGGHRSAFRRWLAPMSVMVIATALVTTATNASAQSATPTTVPPDEAALIQAAAESYVRTLFDIDGAAEPVDIACAVGVAADGLATGGTCYATISRTSAVVVVYVRHEGSKLTVSTAAEYTMTFAGAFADHVNNPAYTWMVDLGAVRAGSLPAVPDLLFAALETAQALATSTAAGDWSTYRAIRPEPFYTDADLVEGYAGLEAVTVELASWTFADDGGVDLYLGLIAHETKAGGRRQTALHCVVWRYYPDTGTVLGISGQAEVEAVAGFVDPASIRPLAWTECA